MADGLDESNLRMPASETSAPSAGQARVERPVAPSLNAPLCPYCGVVVDGGNGADRCASCKGLLDPLSRQATQNAMGPWAVRDDAPNGTPGFSYETLSAMVTRGRIRRDTVVRGPTTCQFWMFAANTPGVAVLLGECHACHRSVRPDEFLCVECGASLNPATDRQTLGLAPVRLLPGAASAPAVAASAVRATAAREPIVEIETPAPLRRGTVEIPVAPAVAIASPSAVPATSHSVSLRRMTSRVHVLTIALVLAVAAMGALLAVLVTMAMRAEPTHEPPSPPPAQPAHTTPSETPASTPEPARDARTEVPLSAPAQAQADPIDAPPSTDPIDMIDGVPIDKGLDRWREDISRAIALEREDSLASLDQAVEILQRVYDEASSARAGGGDSMPILRERVRLLRERADAWRARER